MSERAMNINGPDKRKERKSETDAQAEPDFGRMSVDALKKALQEKEEKEKNGTPNTESSE